MKKITNEKQAMRSGCPLCCNCEHFRDPDPFGWFMCPKTKKRELVYFQCNDPVPTKEWLSTKEGIAWKKRIKK